MTRSPAVQDYQRRALDYVRHVLEVTGLSSGALAKKAGLAPSSVTRPLNKPDHASTLSVRTIGKIAKATGIDPGPFLSIGARPASENPNAFAARPGPEVTFGQRLVSTRAASRISPGDIALACDVSRSAVSQWETNVTFPSTEKLPVLAQLLGVSCDWLLAGQERSHRTDIPALTDLLAFLHLIRAEHGIDVPERHFETLRSLVTTPSVNTPEPGSCLTKRIGAKA